MEDALSEKERAKLNIRIIQMCNDWCSNFEEQIQLFIDYIFEESYKSRKIYTEENIILLFWNHRFFNDLKTKTLNSDNDLKLVELVFEAFGKKVYKIYIEKFDKLNNLTNLIEQLGHYKKTHSYQNQDEFFESELVSALISNFAKNNNFDYEALKKSIKDVLFGSNE
jgi:hypothetical protein